MKWPDDYLNKVIIEDCLEIMKNIPDKAIDVILTDPVWPGCKVDFGIDDPWELFARAGKEFARLPDRTIIHLGCDTDPRFLSGIPMDIPFFRVCWLERVPPLYRGTLMYDADIAYVFGHRKTNGTDRVMGGRTVHASQGLSKTLKSDGIIHPSPRCDSHVRWLISRFSRPGDIILDPFAGSGTTLQEAKNAGRNFIGIEKDARYKNDIERRLSQGQLL